MRADSSTLTIKKRNNNNRKKRHAVRLKCEQFQANENDRRSSAHKIIK